VDNIHSLREENTMTVPGAKAAVEAMREQFPEVGPYVLAKEIFNGGGRVGVTYGIYLALGGEDSFYRILNYIRRYDARQKKAKTRGEVAEIAVA
jgi:hypothetical protein